MLDHHVFVFTFSWEWLQPKNCKLNSNLASMQMLGLPFKRMQGTVAGLVYCKNVGSVTPQEPLLYPSNPFVIIWSTASF
jgi:hypothetical protein